LASYATFGSLVAETPGLAAHRSVFPDLLGCGYSDAPEDFGYTLEEHARTVALLLDELNLNGCNVIGYSMGGAVAITLAAIRPDLISRLSLMEANLDPLLPGQGVVSTGIAGQTEKDFCEHGFQALIGSIRQEAIKGNKRAATVSGIAKVAAPRALYWSAVHLVKGTRPTIRERLLQMTFPRAYIFGELSLPDPDWEALSSESIQVLTVPNAGHGMAFENPAGVAEAIITAFST
jgi:pimeloyl-ACP methyl ester carboxylesterase